MLRRAIEWHVLELLSLLIAAYGSALLASLAVERTLYRAPAIPLEEGPARGPLTPVAIDAARLAKLFGLPISAATTPSPVEGVGSSPEAALPSSLHVELRGTVVGSEPEWSWAIIRDMATSTSVVARLGDAVFDGVLVEVESASIVILRNGHRERISLGNDATVESRPEAPPVLMSSLVERTGNVTGISRSRFADLLAHPTEALRGVRVLPNFEQGRIHGFRVEALPPESVLASAGLHAGDVIQRVNGISLDSMEDALGLLGKVPSLTHAEVEVLRGDTEVTLQAEVR